MDKIKDLAVKAGTSAQKDPRLLRAALNIKETVDAFRQGYRENIDPEAHRLVCPHCKGPLPGKANFCPKCGAHID